MEHKSSSDIELLTVANYDPATEEYSQDERKHPLLPKQPCRILLVGGSASGKTNLAMAFVRKWLNYDRLYLFSKHLEQPKYEALIDDLQSIEEQRGEQVLFTGQSVDDIPPLDSFDGQYRNLVIIDDMLTEANQRPFINMFIRGRHKNITILYLSQSYFRTPRDVRLNSSHLGIFGTDNRREIQMLYSELGTDVSQTEFVTMFRKAVAKKYSFMWIDRPAVTISEKYRVNMDGTGLYTDRV